MPWVYTLQLSEFAEAGKIQTDWENNIPGNASAQNDYGRVTVSGQQCVIVSTRNESDFDEMENMSYVASITESKEIASRGTSDFEPPIELGHGIKLVE